MAKKINGFRLTLFCLYALGLGLWLFFLSRGLDYYTTSYGQRPHHADYRVFKPAGRLGLLFGVVGTAMMLSLLLYVVRKRTRVFGNRFSLASWLGVHIFFGIAGPLFILLHTSFKLNGLVAISFWAMVAVALSGIFGRYLYIQIPRNIQGDQLTMAQIEKQDSAMTQSLAAQFGLDLQQQQTLLESLAIHRSRFLIPVIGGDGLLSLGKMRLRRQLAREYGLPKSEIAKLLRLAKGKAKLTRRLARLDRVLRLFHYWHIIHRPFAAVMYLFMAIHIIVALLFGISWKGN